MYNRYCSWQFDVFVVISPYSHYTWISCAIVCGSLTVTVAISHGIQSSHMDIISHGLCQNAHRIHWTVHFASVVRVLCVCWSCVTSTHRKTEYNDGGMFRTSYTTKHRAVLD